MRRLAFTMFALLALLAAGCNNDPPVAPAQDTDVPKVDTSELARLEHLAAQPDGGVAAFTHGLKVVVVPSGSNDALAGAIGTAGPKGVVLLKKGPHTESGTVAITTSVTIIGEKGAQLISSATTPSAAIPTAIEPALHVRADHVSIQGLTILSAPGDGNTAILIQDADNALVFNNTINAYQFGVLVQNGDHARLWSNTIVGTSLWLTGEIADTENIIVINGSYASVLKNDVSNGLFGIWPCGSNGVLAFNKAHGNFVGLIFCKVPEGGFSLPDGSLVGSVVSSNHWFATENVTVDNFTTGFLCIDGANNNLMFSNASSGNGTYDIDLAGDSFRFGFLTPTSFDNTFIAGRYPAVEVRNCGLNNTIVGGTLVDNTVEPCD